MQGNEYLDACSGAGHQYCRAEGVVARLFVTSEKGSKVMKIISVMHRQARSKIDKSKLSLLARFYFYFCGNSSVTIPFAWKLHCVWLKILCYGTEEENNYPSFLLERMDSPSHA